MSSDTLSQPFREYRGFNLQVTVKFMEKQRLSAEILGTEQINDSRLYIHIYTHTHRVTDGSRMV